MQNKLRKLYFALLNVSLYYLGYFVGVSNFVYMSVHSMSLLLAPVKFHLCEITVLTTMFLHAKHLHSFSALHRIANITLEVQLDTVFFHNQDLYEIVSQALRTKEAESFSELQIFHSFSIQLG